MLPQQYSLALSSEFARTVRNGRRKGSRTVVVYVWEHKAEAGISRWGGPRFGLIVSKAVGNAVVRHRTSRRLRHVCAKLVGQIPDRFDIVVRALPAAANVNSEELMRDVYRTLQKLDAIA